MCVKEVEGAQGQESPYRQEKACGGDGGGGGGGSRLLSDSCLLNTHTHTRTHTHIETHGQLHSPQVLVPISLRVGARDEPVPKHACTHTDGGS